MGKRGRITGAVLVLSMVGLLAFNVLHPKEPTYGGKTLTFWLKEYGDTHSFDSYVPGNKYVERELSARRAIESIGTNAIPFLLIKLNREEPVITNCGFENAGRKESVITSVKRWILQRPFIHYSFYDNPHHQAVLGFETLAHSLSNSLPSLLILSTNADDDIRHSALVSIEAVCEDKKVLIPHALIILTNEDPALPRFAIRFIHEAFPAETEKFGVSNMIVKLTSTATKSLLTNAPVPRK